MGDFHLAFSVDKPMEVFDPVWKNHEKKIQKYVRKVVKDTDTIVITGEYSWGRNLEECRLDLEFIEDLPGQKILLRGNHDMFWDTKKTAKLNGYHRSFSEDKRAGNGLCIGSCQQTI